MFLPGDLDNAKAGLAKTAAADADLKECYHCALALRKSLDNGKVDENWQASRALLRAFLAAWKPAAGGMQQWYNVMTDFSDKHPRRRQYHYIEGYARSTTYQARTVLQAFEGQESFPTLESVAASLTAARSKRHENFAGSESRLMSKEKRELLSLFRRDLDQFEVYLNALTEVMVAICRELKKASRK